MHDKGFNKSEFFEWIENEFNINPFALQLLDNIIDYAHKHEHVSKDQFAYFIADLVPEVEFLDVAKFCEDTILTRDTLRRLGRIEDVKIKVADIKNLPKRFNFKSNINPYEIIYHATEQRHGYKVTCDANSCKWDFSKEEMYKKLLDNDFEICQ